jgi:prolyl 4-hydroxylase
MGQIESIEQAAAAGDVSAMATLGKLALVGQAGLRTFPDGQQLLEAAAEKGDPEADCIISALVAFGAKERQDWSLALGHLKRAAERAWRPAQEQLCLLAADRDLAHAAQFGRCDDKVWAQLRDSVHMETLLTWPAAASVSRTPRIDIFERFASRAECAWMISRGRTRMSPAVTYDLTAEQTGLHEDSSRTNSAMIFNVLDTDFILEMLRARMALATQFSRTRFEYTNVLHYAVGQRFAPHCDYLPPAVAASANQIRAIGQRAATFLIYLNDDFEGGETDFIALRWRYKGMPGDALFFMNVTDDGSPDRQTMHAGLAPTSGEKWILSQWIRGAPGVGV